MWAANELLPLTVQLSGEYERLAEIYPLGKDTYTQNLNLSPAINTAISAGQWNLAVDVFASHNFGYHTAMRYSAAMDKLLDEAANDQARRLTDLVERGLAAYQAEGGLSRCLELKSLEQCQERIAGGPDMARLESFDKGGYANCFILNREKDAAATCLDGIRQRADAEGFDDPEPMN